MFVKVHESTSFRRMGLFKNVYPYKSVCTTLEYETLNFRGNELQIDVIATKAINSPIVYMHDICDSSKF